MDTTHDLGGKQGFGPIPVASGDAPFRHDWERRMGALARSGILQDITIDWFRHGLERMVPGDYVTFPYFAKWVTNYLVEMIDNGTFSLAEVLAGHVDIPGDPAQPLSLAQVLELSRRANISFATDAETPPAHKVGDTIRTQTHGTNSHCRLPAYARARSGTIIAYHGAHPLPDLSAKGIHQGDHLYTVEFAARELWGPDADPADANPADANPADTVTLDLWETYFVRA